MWFLKIDNRCVRQSTTKYFSCRSWEVCTLVLYILAPEKVLLDSLQEGYFLHIQQLDVCPSICSLRVAYSRQRKEAIYSSIPKSQHNPYFENANEKKNSH